MPNYIVLRLTPPAAVDAATFTGYLDGLTINAYDISYNNPTGAPPPIGAANFVGPPFPPAAGTQIVQHSSPPLLVLPLLSVATALVEIPAGTPEYNGPNVRLDFVRGGQTIASSVIPYALTVQFYPALPAGDVIEAIPDDEVSAFLTLPSPSQLLATPNDGTPPNFDALLAAVTTVLGTDPGVAVTPLLLSNLSVAQCTNIAKEIIYGPQSPLPPPPPPLPPPASSLGDMFTTPPNTGQYDTADEQDRELWQGQVTAYYSVRDAEASKLAGYIYALATSEWLELQTQTAAAAVVTFPANPNAPQPPLATETEAQVMFTGALGLDVPAAYFYALTCNLPTSIATADRQTLVFGTDPATNLKNLKLAIDGGWITQAPALNPARAIRILEALNISPATSAPAWPIGIAFAGDIFGDWVAYPPDPAWFNYQAGPDTVFWQNEEAARPEAFVDLVLVALTQGYTIGGIWLADVIMSNLLALPLTNIGQITGATPADWQNFFTNTAPALLLVTPAETLPPFTLPGSVPERIAAFIAAVQQFFQLDATPVVLNPVPAIDPKRYGVPSYDVIAETIAHYPGFFFGMPINHAMLEAAAAIAALGDAQAQAWAVQTIETLNELFILSQIPGETAAFDFSVMEALFARGFTNREEVLDLPFDDFQQTLTGTIAYDHAAVIYGNAGVAPVFPPPMGSPFGPINPGCLTDCIPPLQFSPLGPVAYLHEMLQVSERSTCDHPFAPPAPGHTLLQALIDGRRGPVEQLVVSRANLETPLPLIDIVNECLQFMAVTSPPTAHGTIYDTTEHQLAGYKLCEDHCDHGPEHHDCGCEPHDCGCHDNHRELLECHEPAVIFDALPEYSTPATPVPPNNSVAPPLPGNTNVVPAVWNKLKADFSSCCLPYDQALDVNRTYLDYFRSCRFEEMRTFRKCITELVLDPAGEPADFQSHLWRYPVRLDIAIEYLGLSPEEFTALFNGELPRPCSGREGRDPIGVVGLSPVAATEACLRQNARDPARISVSEFLRCTCLTYCEFYELWKSHFVVFFNGAERDGKFPECEPCCLDDLWLRFPQGQSGTALHTLIVFIRLWQKLRHLCGAGYNFVELADICTVLELFNVDFIRRLAAFQMLRDQFRLRLTGRDHPPAGATGADRTFLLALWVGPGAARWQWAVHHLIEGIAYHARCRHECEERAPEFIKLLETNLDPLSQLAGFDPATPSDTWHAEPQHTLRFAEILSKIYASDFSIGEVLFLFTADTHLDGDDPFPLQDVNEADDSPLGLPDDERHVSLWHLRRRLLEVHVDDEAAERWTWPHIAAAMTHEFGFPAPVVTNFGEHFFPDILAASGVPVTSAARRFTGNLAVTNALMWNAPVGPLHYDGVAHELWAVLPLRDAAVLEQLTRVQQLNANERQAVQDTYFQPRLILSAFAMLFDDFDEAQHRLIEGEHSEQRWHYFQRQFAMAHARCGVLADHLSEHVTGRPHAEGRDVALLILKNLFADENAAPSWENNNGSVPLVTWRLGAAPPAFGGAFAALLGLAGTGLDGEITAKGTVAWREIRDSVNSFGAVSDRENSPVTTVVPAMGLALTPGQMMHVTVRNGLAMADASGEWLGGAEGFEARWHGVLLIDREGEYHFRGGAPTEGDAEPSLHEAHHRSWRVVLKRGQKTWVLLRHHWHGEADLEPAALRLERGAHELTVEFIQHEPEYLHSDDVRRQHTGFEIKYRGPDTDHHLTPIPPAQLFRRYKEGPLDVAGLAGTAAEFLRNRYDSSLRDIRRTYQRAFKAMLFAHRFALSARPHAGEGSELGYMLAQADKFAGWSYYRNAGVFTTHKADFDFNFLPVGDPYFTPAAGQPGFTPAADDRAAPSHKRVAALFDWWERIFDYCRARQEVRAHCGRHLWLLWAEALDQQPAIPDSLLRHMGADARHWPLDLRFFQDQTAPIYQVTTDDLEDDRWTVRAWHADLWLRRLWEHFTVKDITHARPDLWASTNPAALVPGAPTTGNANLLRFLCDGCFDNGAPRRYDDVRRLNDGLRERGRDALICYLCGPGGIAKSPNELSEILLLDVLAGRCEKASRIEEAISAVQTFIRRARLGLEPGWVVSGAFAHLWDCRFISYRVWQACKRRELYKENWVDWSELEKAKKIEAFDFLDEQLKRATLTIAVPGGVDFWPDHLPPEHPALCLLQRRDPAEMQILPAPREGLDLLATPERAARPSWITTVPNPASPAQPPGALAPLPPPPAIAAPKLPFWMECAIRLGTRFIRVAAAAYPPASTPFAPRHHCHPKDPAKDKECCVTCCEECGCEHPAHVDEYYFWLIDAKYFAPKSEAVYSSDFDGEQQDYYDFNFQVSTPWHDPTQLHGLLEWPPEPMVRLAWCRVHNGEFQQPRRSVWGVPYDPTAGTPDISFLGRVGDSLYFEVAPPGGVGFRYDMVPDDAIELESLVLPPLPPLPPPPPGGLPSYPYFVYFEPGARLFPWSLYSPAIAVAHALRAHCRFEAALKWYDLVYNPFDRDNRWALCEHAAPQQPVAGVADVAPPPVRMPDPGCCCDTTDITCRDARHRSLLLHYLDTLLEWGDALMRRKSPEAFQQGQLIFETMRRIMGRHPRVVNNPAHPHQTVATFKPLWAAINPRLMTLYDQLDDRFTLVHECMTMRRLVEMPRKTDAQYWDDDPVRGGWRTTMLHACCDTDGSCRPCNPYRFTFRIQRAKELAAQTSELGNALLAAFEKGDATFLESVRARQEHELARLNLRVREDAWRDSDWQVQALEQSKQSLQSNRRYYANLIKTFPIADEQNYVSQTDVALAERTAANVMEIVAEGMDIVPDVFVGTDDFIQLPIGTKLAGLFKTLARVSNTLADIANTNASLDLTEAGWDRRLDDWNQQVKVLDIQIHQSELLILGAERRRNQSLREQNIQQRTIEQTTETLDLLRDKFTNHATYLFLQKHIADLHRRHFELALNEAYEAQRAFNFELGHTTRELIGRHQWDNLHEGLLAGDRLQLELSHMEKEYFDHNCREYELTKHISLRMCFPKEFLRLKLTGRCHIEIPEWMFDLDYPGQYMRRLQTVSLTIPCVAGPYNEVHCRLTLLRSGTRIDPLPRVPANACCDCCQSRNGYPVCPHDPRWVSENGALEAIATSTGVDDAGLFQVSFQDDRYLPFQFHGAVSHWRIELPHENNYFDMDSLSDVVLNLNYTAREGGEALRRAAREACACDLPGAGWCLFDLRHDFADAWELFHREGDEHRERRLDLHFTRRMFPFVPGDRELFIETMAVLFDRPDHCGCECPQECPCCSDPTRAHHELALRHRGAPERRFSCVASDDWPHLYHGVVSGLCLGPLAGRREREGVSLCFPHGAWPVDSAYLLCRYTLQDKCCTATRPEREDHDRHPGFMPRPHHPHPGARRPHHLSPV